MKASTLFGATVVLLLVAILLALVFGWQWDPGSVLDPCVGLMDPNGGTYCPGS